MKQYATLEATMYFWFAANDTSGSGGDGATPLVDVRLAGAAVDAIPVLSPTPILLTHANYPAGCYEVAIAATAANGFAINNTYAVFCTLAIDSQNPTGFIGSFDLKPVEANAKQLGGTSQTGRDIGANVLLSPGSGAGQLDFTSGVVKSNLVQILGTALTETAGYIAAGFKKLFNVATPLLVASDVMRGTDSAATEAKQDIIDTNIDQIETAVITNAAGVDIAADIIAVKAETVLIAADTNELQMNQGNWATATGFNTVVPDIAGTAPTANENRDAVWNAILTGATFNIANSAGRRVREIGAFAIESGTAQAGTSNSITLAATANGTNGIFNRNLIVLTDNTGKGQTRTVVDYTDKKVVVDREWRVTPDNTTNYQIVPDDTPLTVDHGVARGGTSTTITIREYASSINNAYLCNIITIIAGKGRGQARLVGAYNGTSKEVTICGDNWVEIPDTTSIYVMMPYGTTCTACFTDPALASVKTAIEVDGSKIDHLWEMTEDDGGIRRLTENALEQAPLGTDAIASAVWDKAQTEHVIAGSFGKIISEINQSLNGAKVVIDRAASTFKVYDTDGTTLLFTITKSTVGNVDTLTRT